MIVVQLLLVAHAGEKKNIAVKTCLDREAVLNVKATLTDPTSTVAPSQLFCLHYWDTQLLIAWLHKVSCQKNVNILYM